nr:6-pyruvoyl tetrahydrobiopterin synthase [Arsenicicoccus dermatophilus]
MPLPGLGPDGTATMHGDGRSSDVTPHPGVGRGPVTATWHDLSAACPTILQGRDRMVVALCTQVLGRTPVVLLLDPASGARLASLPVAKGALLGGVYAYVDDQDRLVLVDGTHHLLRVAHERTAAGGWTLRTTSSVSVADFVTGGDPASTDAVVGLSPDRHGHVWLATREGRVGVLDPATGAVHGTRLAAGERIDNSISAARTGVAVVSSHATYLLDDESGEPAVRWRRAYDRGTARKPGQLSWGSGATPTFFGPGGDDYVTVTDNADGQEHLLVLRSSDGELVCSPAIFTPGASGTENSAMAHGRTVVVASTYGYPYPALPEGAGPSVPATAAFARGGIERFEVAEDGSGCTRTWSAPVASAAVPRWSLADDTIYTVERPPVLGGTGPSLHAVALDAATGRVVSRTYVGGPLRDTLEMVGTITPDGVWWQGGVTGVHRITAKR